MTRSARCTTRAGFQITDFQTDGLPSYSSSTNQEFDTALYERIDIVRGANGIQTGVGVPSATINMIRKRPQREFGGLCGAHGGLLEPVSGRAGPERTAQQRRQRAQPPGGGPAEEESFRDRYSEDKTALLAAVEADIGQSTVVALWATSASPTTPRRRSGHHPAFCHHGWAHRPADLHQLLAIVDTLGAHLRHALRHAGPPAQRRLEPEGGAEPHRGRHLPPEHLRLRRRPRPGPHSSTRDGRGHHAVCRRERRQRKAGHGGRLPVGQVRAGRPQARPGGGHEFHPHRLRAPMATPRWRAGAT